MKFRPCIDIHNGKVRQIVGSSLSDEGDRASVNYTAERNAAYYADLFRRDGLTGGHIILLNHRNSPYYEETKRQALEALAAWPGGMQVGGGINDENASSFLDAGASQVIVTSFVFRDGLIDYENLARLERAVGRERIVLDLSCRKKEEPGRKGQQPGTKGQQPGLYYIMTDRWQKYTETPLSRALMEELSAHACEFLVHAVSAEGKRGGIDGELAGLLAESPVPVTYAGGISCLDDIRELERLGRGKVDYTVGSALDLYGGDLPYRMLI